MPRHSKNNCARPVFTAWEKANTHEWGTASSRMTGDSMKPFQNCVLCLSVALVPLADPQGHIYCKQCIYEYLLDQKKQYKQKKKDYAGYKAKLEEIEKSKDLQKKQEEMKIFEMRQLGEVTDKDRNEAAAKKSHWDANMKSFWLPSQSPEGLLQRVEKPSKITKSPFGFPISLKELVALNLTEEKKERRPEKEKEPVDEKGGEEGETEKDKADINSHDEKRYICPVCLKSLNQVQGIFAVRGTGSAFCASCFNTVLKKDMIDPVTNTTFTKDDLIELETEGTSFSSRAKERAEASNSSIPAPRFG